MPLAPACAGIAVLLYCDTPHVRGNGLPFVDVLSTENKSKPPARNRQLTVRR